MNTALAISFCAQKAGSKKTTGPQKKTPKVAERPWYFQATDKLNKLMGDAAIPGDAFARTHDGAIDLAIAHQHLPQLNQELASDGMTLQKGTMSGKYVLRDEQGQRVDVYVSSPGGRGGYHALGAF